MPAEFDDKFSQHAKTYAKYRPLYPAALFEHLAGLAPGRDLAWDTGTGSGQAAIGLAPHFHRVIATDASRAQIEHTIKGPRIEFRVAPADQSGLEAQCVDLITAASAVHWFDLDSFYSEARRVLRPRGVIAAWCYREPHTTPAIDQQILRFQNKILSQFWSPKINLVMDGYRSLPFPFDELPAPDFEGAADWTLSELIGYLRTWSATRDYERATGVDPISLVDHDLAAAWGDPSRRRTLVWPIFIRVGRLRTTP